MNELLFSHDLKSNKYFLICENGNVITSPISKIAVSIFNYIDKNMSKKKQ